MMELSREQIQDGAQEAWERVTEVVQDPEWVREQLEGYGVLLAVAVVSGALVASAKPRPSVGQLGGSKKVLYARVITDAAILAYTPVSGCVDVITRVAGTALVQLVHRGVANRPGRFLLTAGIVAGVSLAARRAKEWAKDQPKLNELEEYGLAAWLESQYATRRLAARLAHAEM